MIFSGTLANLDAALSGMIFTPTANFTGASQVQIVTSDLGNTGIGGPLSKSSSVTINVHAPPTSNTVPGAQATVKNTSLVFSPPHDNGIYIGSGWNYVELDATNGKLTLATTSGLSFSSGNGTNNTKMQFGGSVAAMNAAVNGLTFIPTSGYTGAAQVKVITSNSGLLGLGLLASSSTSTIAITVTVPAAAINQPPKVTVPATQSIAEGATLSFNGGNPISVSDPDGGTSSEQVTLVATGGTLTLATTTGLTFASGTGAGDISMTFTGTLSNIDADLGGLQFSPAGLYYGSAGVYIAIDDLGNTGTGGAKTASATVAIAISRR